MIKIPVASVRRESGWVWQQPVFYPVWTLEIIKGSTTYDVTDVVLIGSVDDGATETIGSFNVKIANYTGTYTNVFTGNEQVKFYTDYAATASTLRFLGRIDKVSYTNNTIVITGRSEAVAYLGITVTKQYSNQNADFILKDLIDNYSYGFTYVNVQSSSTTMTVNWYQKPFWDCVKEICDASSSDAYIDSSKDWHFFPEKSITNTTEAIVHGANLLDTGEFAEDKAQIRNRVIVSGQRVDGLPLIYTAENIDSYNDLGRWQEEPIDDTNITTMTQAQERATFELAVRVTPPIVGELSSIGLPTLNPGDKLRISDPDNGISPGAYRVISFKHKFGHDTIMQTTVTIEKSSPTVSSVLKDRIIGEQQLADSDNPYEMRYSFNLNFNDNTLTETHNGTEIQKGYLIASSGTGTFTSITQTVPVNVSKYQVKMTGETTLTTQVYLSFDGGGTWEQAIIDANITPVTMGRDLKVRVIVNSADTQVDGVAILYR